MLQGERLQASVPLKQTHDLSSFRGSGRGTFSLVAGQRTGAHKLMLWPAHRALTHEPAMLAKTSLCWAWGRFVVG